MKKNQRFRYEMFVRVRDYGTAHRDLFPESSNGGHLFAQVAAAVAAIEENLTGRGRARAEAQRVKSSTRGAVADSMKAIVATARRVLSAEPGSNPFKMPTQQTAAAILGQARLFIEEAQKRPDDFGRLEMTPESITEFVRLVDQLDQAVEVQLNSRTRRREAQTGLETALASGLEIIRNLDVVIANVARQDPVRYGAWRAARRIEALHRKPSPSKTSAETPAATPAAVQTVALAEAAPAIALSKAS